MIASSSSVASLRLDDPLHGARLVADTRPRSPGSIASTATSAIAAWSRRRSSRSSSSSAGLEQRRVAGQDEDLVDVVGERREGGRDGVAGAARLGLEGVVDVVAERVADGRGRGARDDERAATGRRAAGVDDVGDHRPAGQRVEELRRARLHPRAEAGGHDDRDDPRGGAGTWGVHEGRRERASVGDGGDPDAVRARRVSVWMSSKGAAIVWVPARSVNRRPWRRTLDAAVRRATHRSALACGAPRAATLVTRVRRERRSRQAAGDGVGDRRRAIASISTRRPSAGRDAERRAGRRRIRHELPVDRVDGGEVVDVGEEDRRLHDVGEARRRPRRAPAGGSAARARPGPRRPSTSSPVAGSSPTWPEQNTRSPRRSPGCTARRAAGAPLVWIAWRVIGRSSRSRGSGRASGTSSPRRTAGRRRAPSTKPVLDGRPDGRRRELRVVERRIERPEGRAGAGQADRAGRAGASARGGTATRPSTTVAAAGSRSLAAARTPARSRSWWAVSPDPNSLAKCSELRAATPGAPIAPSGPGREHAGGVGGDRRRHEQQTRVAASPAREAEAVERRHPLAAALDEGRAAGEEERDVAPDRRGERRPLRRRVSSPCAAHASSAPSIAAAASLLPPASPAATGIRLSSRTASAGGGAGEPAAERPAGRADRAEDEVVGDRTGVEARRRGGCPGRPATDRPRALSRSASSSGTITEWSAW